MTEVSEGNGRGEAGPGPITLDPPTSAAKPKVVPHFTPAERAARGKAARAEVPRSSQAEIDFPKSRDPVGAAGGAGGVAGAGAGADPLRADAGVAVRVLSRRRADHGGGSGADAELGLRVAAVR